MKWLEIKFWQLAKYIIKKEYGANCLDYARGCAECEAKKVIDWIDSHISLINEFN